MSKKEKSTIRQTISHLKHDIKESRKGIRRDKQAIRRLNKLLNG